jgi:hypothetical protein
MTIILSPRSGEGRLLETILKAERGAAPAGGARNPALGRSRDPTGGHYDPSARSSLDRAVSGLLGRRRSAVLSRRRQNPRKEETGTWKRGPGIGNRRGGAPRGDAPCARARAPCPSKPARAKADERRGWNWRLSAPRPPLFFRGRLPAPLFRGRLPVPLFRGAAKFLAKLGRSPRRENDGACPHDTSKPDR